MTTSPYRFRHTPLAALATLCGLAAPLPALAQSYTFTQGTGTYTSISGTGTPVTMSGTDDGSGTINLPFSFQFFGSPVSAVYPTTNGLLCFGSVSTSYSPVPLPSADGIDGFVAGFWDDMSVPAGSAVYYRSTGSAGSRVFTIEWFQLTPLSSSDYINYQVRLYESTGNIDIIYGSSLGGSGSAGVGIEDLSGATAYGPSCGLGGFCSMLDVAEGTLLTFSPSGAPPMLPDLTVVGTSPLPTSVTPGGTYSIDVNIRNAGGVSAPETDVQVYAEVFGSTMVIGEGFISGLGAGQSGVASVSIGVPSGVPDGSYPITVIVDPFNGISEANETNNLYNAGSVTVGMTSGSITITTNTLPQGSVGTTYSFQIQQTGATSPSWTASGSLPPGLTLSSGGRLSGSPSTAGNFIFTVQCAQSGLAPGSRTFEVEIITATGFRVSSGQLPEGTVGQAYTGRIEATGGQAPYAFQIVSGKPGWLNMAADGALSGTPDATGMHELRVSVFDSATMFTEGVVMLEVVQGGPLMLVTMESDVVPGVVGLPYTIELRAAGGMQPYTFSIGSGSLPDGVSLSGSTISGVPSSGGRSTFEVRVSDAGGGSVNRQFSIEVADRVPLVMSVLDTLIVRPDSETNLALQASGGVPPYTWAVISGALPVGLRLESGTILGTATSSRATAHVTLQVSDTQGESVQKSVTIEVRKSTANNSGGAGRARESGGCASMAQSGDQAPILALLAMALVGVLRRRRRGAFLRTASMVDDPACPSRSSRGAPRSSRP